MTLDNCRQGDGQQREQTASQEHNGASTSSAFVSAPGRSPAALAFRWYRRSLMPSFGRLEDLFPQEPFLQLPLFHGSMMSDAAAIQLASAGELDGWAWSVATHACKIIFDAELVSRTENTSTSILE